MRIQGLRLHVLFIEKIILYINRHCLVTKSCPTLCDPTDYCPPGSSVHGILQARLLQWVKPVLSLGNLPDPEIKARSPTLQTNSLSSELPGKPRVAVDLCLNIPGILRILS